MRSGAPNTLAGLAALAGLAVMGHAPVARADTPAGTSTPALADGARRRALPDYDGRGARATTAGDVALWIPRVALFPAYVVAEYVIRKPLGFLLTTAERNNWPTIIASFFTFDRDNRIGITPSAFLDFGFRPSVGAYFFWDDFAAKGNDLRLYGATWGEDWIAASVADRIALGPPDSAITFRASYTRRKDWAFHGLGPRSLEASRSRYGSDAFDVGGMVDYRLARGIYFHSAVGVRAVRFTSSPCCFEEDPGIVEAAAAGLYPLPPGFARGYAAAYQRLQVSADTRQKWPADGSGVRVALEGEPSFDLAKSPGTSWIRYGATLGAYVDLTGTRRVLGVVVATTLVDAIGTAGAANVGDAIPFTEQATLGGAGFLRGYRPGRLVDRSSLVAQLEYRWPIWMWLDGSMQFGVGNVFGEHLAGFDPKLLRMSGSLGVRTSNSPDHQLEVLFGGGTETFAQGAALTSMRLFVGATRGF